MRVIKTIEDDEEVEDLDNLEIEQIGQEKNHNKKTKSKKSKNEKGKGDEGTEDFDSNFVFDSESVVKSSWDFTNAKKSIQPRSADNMDIDQMIKKYKSEENLSEDDDEDEDDGDGSEDEKEVRSLKRKRKNHDVEEDTEDEEEEDENIANDDDDDDDDEDEDDDDDEEKEEIKKKFFTSAPEEFEDTFEKMKLSRPILRAITALGFTKPTPIQARSIPIALQGKDLCAGAVTGSGKTAAFIIPVLERLLFRPREAAATRVLILTPTRELAVQCHSVAVKLARFTDIQFCLAIGGLSNKIQEAELRRKSDVLIATPGRLIDHLQNTPGFDLDSIEILILDEADRMLDEGFRDELNEIVRSCPRGRQTLLFSASMTDEVDELANLSLNKPVRLFVDKSGELASNLTQEFVRVRSTKDEDREAMIAALCKRTFKSECIVFFNSKKAAHRMKIVFGLMGLESAELHGDLTQKQRLEALEKFRDGEVNYLLCTDVAARGLDIVGITTVINYSMPKNYKQYLHRVGRTARAGRKGRSVTLVGESERKVLKLAVKNARDVVKKRTIPPEVLQKYKKKIENMNQQIDSILREEKTEREFQKADMEINKAQNMIHHKDEIMSRPAKTWFQSSSEKQKSKEISSKLHADDLGMETKTKGKGNDKEEVKRGKFDGMNRKKKRRLISIEETKDLMGETNRAISEAKKQSKPKRVTVVKEDKNKKKSNKNTKSTSFAEEKTSTKRKEKSSKETPPKKSREQKERDRERKQKFKAPSKKFKSKSRFKRR